jgi:hypothetical protein
MFVHPPLRNTYFPSAVERKRKTDTCRRLGQAGSPALSPKRKKFKMQRLLGTLQVHDAYFIGRNQRSRFVG